MTTPNEKPATPVATLRVWDGFVRLFHWILVLGFAIAFISGEVHASKLHALVGYTLSVLLLARFYWGFRGSHYARFRSFTFSASETSAYVRSLRSGQPRHYFGHNPAGALMVFALLVAVSLLLLTGLATFAVIDFDGPLLFLANSVSDETSYTLRKLHKLLPPVALGLVGVHLLGVVSGCLMHKENLVRAMITGNKTIPATQSRLAKEQ